MPGIQVSSSLLSSLRSPLTWEQSYQFTHQLLPVLQLYAEARKAQELCKQNDNCVMNMFGEIDTLLFSLTN